VRLRSCGLASLLVASVLGLAGTQVSAQTSGNPGGGAFGGDQQATGELLGDGSAEAVARDGSDLGDEAQPRPGGGNVICRYYDDATGDPVNPWNLPAELNGLNIQVLRMCDDADTGEYVSIDLIIVVPPLTAAPDSRELAMMARSRLPLPLPEARMNPDGDQTVNLETWLWVDNWETQTRSATAGGVTSVVIATPVEQRWTFGSPSEKRICSEAGTPYDMARPASEQSTTCSYTFRHSSAGQPDDAYRVTVTLVWHVTWTSNIGASGDLGFVSRTATISARVAEHQALNDSRSGQ
jgi:hypothetical protein